MKLGYRRLKMTYRCHIGQYFVREFPSTDSEDEIDEDYYIMLANDILHDRFIPTQIIVDVTNPKDNKIILGKEMVDFFQRILGGRIPSFHFDPIQCLFSFNYTKESIKVQDIIRRYASRRENELLLDFSCNFVNVHFNIIEVRNPPDNFISHDYALEKYLMKTKYEKMKKEI